MSPACHHRSRTPSEWSVITARFRVLQTNGDHVPLTLGLSRSLSRGTRRHRLPGARHRSSGRISTRCDRTRSQLTQPETIAVIAHMTVMPRAPPNARRAGLLIAAASASVRSEPARSRVPRLRCLPPRRPRRDRTPPPSCVGRLDMFACRNAPRSIFSTEGRGVQGCRPRDAQSRRPWVCTTADRLVSKEFGETAPAPHLIALSPPIDWDGSQQMRTSNHKDRFLM